MWCRPLRLRCVSDDDRVLWDPSFVLVAAAKNPCDPGLDLSDDRLGAILGFPPFATPSPRARAVWREVRECEQRRKSEPDVEGATENVREVVWKIVYVKEKKRRKSSKLYFLKTNSAKVRKNAEREYKLNRDDGWRSTAFFSSFVKSWPFFSSVLIVISCSWEKNYKIFFSWKIAEQSLGNSLELLKSPI